jgi:hypothetical protein
LKLPESQVDRSYLLDVGYVEDHAPHASAQRRIDALEARAGQVESSLLARIARRARIA